MFCTKRISRLTTLKLRRTILANLPSAYIGLNNYWLEK